MNIIPKNILALQWGGAWERAYVRPIESILKMSGVAKRPKMLIVALFFVGLNSVFGQPKEIPLNSQTVFKDINGKRISFETFLQWTSGHGYEIAPSFDEDGKLLEVFVLEASVAAPRRQVSSSAVVPSFSATDIRGQSYTMDDLRGKVVVLKFWFAACKPCVDEIPQLNTLVQQYENNSEVVFLGASLDKEGTIRSFLQKHPFLYHILPESRSLADMFNVFGYPTHFVINRLGKIEATFSGVNRQIHTKLSAAIERALVATETDVSTTDVPPPPMPEEVIITPASVIKNEEGERISFDLFSELMRTQNYELLHQQDSLGNGYVLIKQVR